MFHEKSVSHESYEIYSRNDGLHSSYKCLGLLNPQLGRLREEPPPLTKPPGTILPRDQSRDYRPAEAASAMVQSSAMRTSGLRTATAFAGAPSRVDAGAATTSRASPFTTAPPCLAAPRINTRSTETSAHAAPLDAASPADAAPRPPAPPSTPPARARSRRRRTPQILVLGERHRPSNVRARLAGAVVQIHLAHRVAVRIRRDDQRERVTGHRRRGPPRTIAPGHDVPAPDKRGHIRD